MRLVARHAEVGYVPPASRDACRWCKSFDSHDEDRVGVAVRWRCKLHQLDVESGAICPQFVKAGGSLYFVVMRGRARQASLSRGAA